MYHIDDDDTFRVMPMFVAMTVSRCNCRWEWRVLMGNHRCWCQNIKEVCKFCMAYSHL